LGDGWSRSVDPEDLALWLDTFVRAFDAREPFEVEYRLRRRDGAYRWVLDRGLPRYSRDGVFLGFVGSCIDIDERKRAEHELARSLERERKLRIATEEASRLKDGFLASVLSDLQSPVQAIATWAAHLRGQVAAASKPAAGRGSMDEPLLTGVKVLIVDDDPAAREAVAKVLSIAGAQTKAASSS